VSTIGIEDAEAEVADINHPEAAARVPAHTCDRCKLARPGSFSADGTNVPPDTVEKGNLLICTICGDDFA
jgi:hypothetical protein